MSLTRTLIAVTALSLFLTGQRLMASSTVVWSGQQDIQMGPSFLSLLSIDMNSDGTSDLGFEFYMDLIVRTPGDSAVTTQNIPSWIWKPWPVAAGTTIGATPGASSQWGTSDYTLSDWEVVPGYGWMGGGHWGGTTNGYIGVSFSAADGTHYGWVCLTVSDANPVATIHDWAYEGQPGVEIATGVVPEPATWQLCIVGIALAGLAMWRRRQNTQSVGK